MVSLTDIRNIRVLREGDFHVIGELNNRTVQIALCATEGDAQVVVQALKHMQGHLREETSPCTCGHDRKDHTLTSGSGKPYDPDVSEPCEDCDCYDFEAA